MKTNLRLLDTLLVHLMGLHSPKAANNMSSLMTWLP